METKRESGFVPVIVLIFLVALSIVGYSIYQNYRAVTVNNTPTPSPISTKTPDPTTNWKTYQNANAGISFKYPKNIEELFAAQAGVSGPNTGKSNYVDTFADKATVVSNTDSPFDGFSVYEIDPGTLGMSFDEYINKEVAAVKSSPRDVSNASAVKVTFGGQTFTYIDSEVNIRRYFILSPDNLRIVIFSRINSTQGFLASFNQILSTFKFLGQEAGQDKTYVDPQNRYSFSYPATWQIISAIPDEFLYHDYSKRGDWMSYFNSPEGVNWWLTGKMFLGSCRGPLLQNSQDAKELIALEIVPANSDGGYCWSSGYFFEGDKWQVAQNYMYPITKDNSGQLIAPIWKGDFFKFVDLGKTASWMAAAGLANRETFSLMGTDALSKIVATFKFTN